MTRTYFLWDGENILQESDENHVATAVYTYEPRQYGNLISERRGATSSYYHFDALGSTREMTNSAGAVADTFVHNAWGEQLARTGTTPTPFRWVGEVGYYWDSETAQVSIRQRLYQLFCGRWTALDPLWIPLFAVNRYTYVQNRPLYLTDPSGLVIRDFSPVMPDSMDWCEVGASDRWDFEPRFPHKPIRPDPNGLPSGRWGNTDANPYKIICICTCVDHKKRLFDLQCVVQAYLKLRIAPGNFPPPRHAGSKTPTLPGVYGHEQLHVRNFLEGAESWASSAANREAANSSVPEATCIRAMSDLVTTGNHALQNWINREDRHKHPSGVPQPGENYPEIGSMPGTPNCAAPGMPNKVPSPVPCCTTGAFRPIQDIPLF